MNEQGNSVELRASGKVWLLFYLLSFGMGLVGLGDLCHFASHVLDFDSVLLPVLSWAFIWGVAFITGYRVVQNMRIEANNSGVVERFGRKTRRYSWNQISVIVAEPVLNGYRKVVGSYPALKSADGTILMGIEPSAWGSSTDVEIFVAFVEKKLTET